MLIIKKKRIVMIVCMIFISLYAFSFKIANEDINRREKTRETVSTPVSDKVVIVDAGHGTPDERCRKFQWNNRSTNKFKNCIEIAKIT